MARAIIGLKEVIDAQSVNVATGGNITLDNGNLVIGTSGKGIDFSTTSDSSGSSSELLDDYEEGTWAPIFKGSTSDPVVAYNATGRIGRYTKIGNQVTVWCRMEVDGISSVGSGNLFVAGLPFQSDSTNDFAAATIGVTFDWPSEHPIAGFVDNGTDRIQLTKFDTTDATSRLIEMTTSDLAATSNDHLFVLTATYKV